jgi:thiamine kinase-like enzyme
VIETPETVLRDLPEWADAAVERLACGQTVGSWLIDAGDRKAVLKIDDAPRTAPFNTRRAEAQIQTGAARQGLANHVLLVTDTVLMTEYVDGVVWSLDCLEDSANIAQLAAALRKLHSLPLTGRTFDAPGAAREYAGKIVNGDQAKIRDCLRKIEAGPLPPNLCCCHNDLVVANILNTPETRFLDWEYACDNDPFFDLATIAAHHGLSEAQQVMLLDAYFDGNGARWYEQLARQADRYDALLYLWEQSRN